MISLTVERARTVSRPEEILIITNAGQKDAVASEVGDVVPIENIIGEPMGRNTAPAIGLAAVVARKRYGDAAFLVLPADHLVEGQEKFEAAVRVAESYATDHDCLLTFGIAPARPETGYGYIRAGKHLRAEKGVNVFEAVSFHEKPTPDRAREFVEDGSFVWNSGMFCWRPGPLLGAISVHEPELYRVLTEIDTGLGTAELDSVLNSTYSRAPSTSIDYAVMEKADNVVVVRGDFYWNDIGCWESIRDVYARDESGNVLVGEHLVVDSADNTIFSPERTVGVVGLKNVVLVDAGDAILVCARDRVQQVREIVDILKKKGKKELL
jgi:mannose-1-phosphate guanylyltransferase